VKLVADPNYVSPAEWAEWEGDHTAVLARAKADRERKAREQPQLIEALTERIEDLEVRVLVLEEALAAAWQMVGDRSEQLAFYRELLAWVCEGPQTRPAALRLVA
jgi:hypothetical protein